jgi:hypothetical protein
MTRKYFHKKTIQKEIEISDKKRTDGWQYGEYSFTRPFHKILLIQNIAGY